jgi:7-cyano-7-deazaguanine synthase
VETKKIALLFSGGLESTCLVNYYSKRNFKIHLLYIKFGYNWEVIEFQYAKKIARYYNLSIDILDFSSALDVKQLGKVKNLKDNIIPLRNLSLLVLAAMHISTLDINKLSFGLQGNSEYPDTSKEYIHSVEKLINQGLSKNNFIIEMPFYNKVKKDIFLENKEIPLDMVFSCTNPKEYKRCHTCYKCQALDNLLNSLKEL